MNFIYPSDDDDFSFIFGLVKKYYTEHEQVPDYTSDIKGVEKIKGVVDMAKMGYYPTFFDKATYILLQINQGHFFENGNKRLALVVFLYFIYTNSHDFEDYSKEKYGERLKEIFPEYTNPEDFERFDPKDFAYYNLSILIADSKKYGISFDDLKTRVKEYIDFSVFQETP